MCRSLRLYVLRSGLPSPPYVLRTERTTWVTYGGRRVGMGWVGTAHDLREGIRSESWAADNPLSPSIITSSLTYPSLLPSETRGRSPSDGRWGVGDEWSERSVTERGKQEQTRRGPSFPSSLRSLRPRFVPSVSHHVSPLHSPPLRGVVPTANDMRETRNITLFSYTFSTLGLFESWKQLWEVKRK